MVPWLLISTITLTLDFIIWIIELICGVIKFQKRTVFSYLMSISNILLVYNVYNVFQDAIADNNVTPIRLLSWKA